MRIRFRQGAGLRRRWLYWLVAGLVGIVGCAESEAIAPPFAGLEPPTGWSRADPSTYSVTGRALSAWRGPHGSSLVVFRSLPSPSPSPTSLAVEETNRLRNLPTMEVEPPRTMTIGGQSAARVEAVGLGTGDALAPSGAGAPVALGEKPLVMTRRVAIGRPTPGGTYWLIWHFPEASRAEVEPEVDRALATIKSS